MSTAPHLTSPERRSPDVDVVIIGGGFAGLCMAIHLRRARRHSFLILESGPDVGGTWRANTYPGCGCDIPSHVYSFSFELNPDWSRMYPSQAEIWEYLRRCVDRYDLRRSIRFNCEAREAVFDEGAGLWRVRTEQGDTVSARIVVTAMGGLNRPRYPTLAGLDTFQGRQFHSSLWDHTFDFRGQRVAVIGTGASAIQFVPQIAPQVAQLHLFQRSAPWILPKWDRPIRPWERALLRRVPLYINLFRAFLYWRQEMLGFGYTVRPRHMQILQQWGLQHLARSVPDPRVRERLTPNYTIGCKRVLISNDFYPAMCRPNVELVTDAVSEVRAHSIVTRDGVERPVDAIIFGTGFQTLDLLSPIRVVGRNGVVLNDLWHDGGQAYYGLAVAGFPNLFFFMGPNSRVTFNSIVTMIEAQARYFMRCLDLFDERRLTTMEVRAEAQADFNDRLQRRTAQTVYVTGCTSWYLNSKGQNAVLWPGFSFQYWRRTRRVNAGDYLLAAEA